MAAVANTGTGHTNTWQHVQGHIDTMYICLVSLHQEPISNAVAMLNVPLLLPPIVQNSDRPVRGKTHRPLAVLAQARLVSRPVVRDLDRRPAVAGSAIAAAVVPSPCDDGSASAADNIQGTPMHPPKQGSRDFQQCFRQCRPCSHFLGTGPGNRHLRRRGSTGADLRGSWTAIR